MTRSPGTDRVVVVGAGPAGTSLGCLLAARGVEVLILDRATFPRFKPCGECVNPGATSVLERMDLLEAVHATAPATIEGWAVETSGGARAYGGYRAGSLCGLGIGREVLDTCLARAARKRGVRIQEGVRVDTVEANGSGGYLIRARRRDGGPAVWRAGIVVGADGLRSVVARRLSLVKRLPRLRKFSLTCRLRGRGPSRRDGRLHLGPRTTVGLAPVHGVEPVWNLTVVVRQAGRAIGSPVDTMRSALRATGWRWAGRGPEIVAGPWASGPFDWPMRAVVADGVLLIGDAAGYFDPLTGQGIYQALRSAELAAPVIHRALRSGRTRRIDLVPYQRALRRELRGMRAFQHAMEMGLAMASMRDRVIGSLAGRRRFADRIVQVAGNTASVWSLMSPGALRALAGGSVHASGEEPDEASR